MKLETVKERVSDIFWLVWFFIEAQSSAFKLGFNTGRPGIAVVTYRLTNPKGGGGGSAGHSAGVLGIIAAGVGGTFGFLFLLIIGGQIGGTSGIYGGLSASNISAITGNIGKAVVTGSSFVILIYLGAGVAIAAAMIFLALSVFRHRGG